MAEMNVRNVGKAAQNKKEKRDALLNAAYRLFTEQGFAETSIAQIAQEAGVAKGTFYLYFKDKYDLRDSLVRSKAADVLGKALDDMEEAHAPTFEDKILFMADSILTQFTEDRRLMRIINKNLSWGVLKSEMGSVTPASHSGRELNLSERFQQGVKQSPIKYRDPEIMLYLIVEFVGSTCYSSIMEDDPLPIDQLKPHILDAIRAIMRSQEVPA